MSYLKKLIEQHEAAWLDAEAEAKKARKKQIELWDASRVLSSNGHFTAQRVIDAEVERLRKVQAQALDDMRRINNELFQINTARSLSEGVDWGHFLRLVTSQNKGPYSGYVIPLQNGSDLWIRWSAQDDDDARINVYIRNHRMGTITICEGKLIKWDETLGYTQDEIYDFFAPLLAQAYHEMVRQ